VGPNIRKAGQLAGVHAKERGKKCHSS
jgi:hypothetical protein